MADGSIYFASFYFSISLVGFATNGIAIAKLRKRNTPLDSIFRIISFYNVVALLPYAVNGAYGIINGHFAPLDDNSEFVYNSINGKLWWLNAFAYHVSVWLIGLGGLELLQRPRRIDLAINFIVLGSFFLSLPRFFDNMAAFEGFDELALPRSWIKANNIIFDTLSAHALPWLFIGLLWLRVYFKGKSIALYNNLDLDENIRLDKAWMKAAAFTWICLLSTTAFQISTTFEFSCVLLRVFPFLQ